MKEKGIIYYTDNALDESIATPVMRTILQAGLPIVSSSLEAIPFGDNEVMHRKRGFATMVMQIVSCLERSKSKYVFFCEHDVLYHPSHFEFTPDKDDTFFYNLNTWRWKFGSGIAIQHDRMISLSGLCVNRKFALDHFNRRLLAAIDKRLDKEVDPAPKQARIWGFEPGTKSTKRGGFSNDKYETWESFYPNIDIRHKNTLTMNKTTLGAFIHKPKWWKEIPITEVPGWSLATLWN